LKALLLAPLAFYPIWEALYIKLTRINLESAKLPPGTTPISMLFLSDLHISRRGRRERNLHRLLTHCPQVDLLLLGGDIAREERGMALALDILSTVKASAGVFAVLGNSEHKNGAPTEQLARTMRDRGVQILVNENKTVSVKGCTLAITGVDDPYEGLDRPEAALSGIPDDCFKILLAHSPEVIVHMAGLTVDLILAGHTHGGQIRLPKMRAIYTHNVRGVQLDSGMFTSEALRQYNPKIADGISMYISRGVGCSLIPARFLCPPEVVLITVSPSQREINP